MVLCSTTHYTVESVSLFSNLVNKFQDTFFDGDYMINKISVELETCPAQVENIDLIIKIYIFFILDKN